MTITLSASAALVLIVCLQFGGLLKPAPYVQSLPAPIENSADLPISEINPDLAERLIGRKEHLTFTKLATLDPPSAAILARHPANLSFPALQEISPEVAKAFASKKHLWLNLGGLQELSLKVAMELGQAKCALSLDGIRTITPEVADALVRGNGTLSLGLTSITKEVADALGQHSGWLTLHNLRELDRETAAALSRHKHWLSLDGLNSLTPQVAESLGRFNGTNLELKSVKTLDRDCAEKLSHATCRGGLYLDGLKTITPDIVNELSRGTYMLSLQGLDKSKLDAETLQSIQVAQTTSLDKLKELLTAEMRDGKPAGTDNGDVSGIDDHKNIIGTWRLTSVEDSGRVVPQDQLNEVTFLITETKLISKIAGRKSESTYELRPSRNPKEIELTEAGVTKPGIYELKGDTLRLCVSQGDKERPVTFRTHPDSQKIVFRLKRVILGDEKGALDTDNSSDSVR